MMGARRDPRRGAHALEFALVLPLFVVLGLGTMEWGWFFFAQASVRSAVHEGCRAGAVTDPEGDPGPEAVAEDAIRDRLARVNILCADDADCAVDVNLTGNSPEEFLDCTVDTEFQPLLDFGTMPTEVGAYTRTLLELQR